MAALMGPVFAGFGALQEGKAAQLSSEYQAKQLDQAAKQATAESQSKAQETRRQAALLQSKGRAAAAAGGGTTTDVGVSNILSGIEAEGELGALNALFEGKEEARGFINRGRGAIFEGKQARKASKIKAISTVISGVGDVARAVI